MTGEHPAWCSPALCDVGDGLPPHGGAHRSEPIQLDVGRLSVGFGRLIQVASASLWQMARSWPTSTYVVLEDDRGRQMSLPLENAAGVLIQLTDLIREGATS